jgi:hypothetical protein
LIDGNGWWGDGRLEGEEGFMEAVEGCELFVEGTGGGGCGDGFRGGIHADWELGEGLEFLHGDCLGFDGEVIVILSFDGSEFAAFSVLPLRSPACFSDPKMCGP